MGIMHPTEVMKNIVPVIMAGSCSAAPPFAILVGAHAKTPAAGILGIYGLIVAAILVGKIAAPVAVGQNAYSGFAGFAHLAAGLACGLSSLSAGWCLGRGLSARCKHASHDAFAFLQ